MGEHGKPRGDREDEDRRSGVRASLSTLGINPVKGKKRVDQTEFQYGGPHARIHAQRHAYGARRSALEMGATSITLGERSLRPNRE